MLPVKAQFICLHFPFNHRPVPLLPASAVAVNTMEMSALWVAASEADNNGIRA